MKFKNRPVKVQLVGGLGNQLFGYFLALSLAEKYSTNCVVYRPRYSSGETNHNVGLEVFKLSDKPKVVFKDLAYFIWSFDRVLNFLSKKSKKLQFLFWHIFRNYFSTEVGFDEQVYRVKPGIKIHGYYQSYKYVSELPKEDVRQNLKLKKNSPWYSDISRVAEQTRPIFLHFRRGDYVNVDRTVGIISLDYYENAIKFLRTKGNSSNIWIVSDDIQEVQEIISNNEYLNRSLNKWVCVSPPKDSDPAESLLLMTFGSAIVTANSTFSWWAAFLGEEDRTIISPIPWFKSLNDPDKLIPNNWVRIKA